MFGRNCRAYDLPSALRSPGSKIAGSDRMFRERPLWGFPMRWPRANTSRARSLFLLTSVNDIDSRFEGSKTSGGTINLEKYRGKMGTGLTDAYQLLMQIEGTPCLKVKTGKLELVTLTKHFGGSAKDLTYMGVEVSAEDMQKLGMAVEPKMYNGQLMIKCTKPGVAHITVKAVGGGNRPGTGSVMGGIEITKTFAVIARETGAENGGWL